MPTLSLTLPVRGQAVGEERHVEVQGRALVVGEQLAGEAEAERFFAADSHRRQRVGLVRQPEPVPRVVIGERGALLNETILFPVPHRHFTFSIPKMLRPYFRFDRDLLKDLCRLAQYIIRNPFAVEKMQVSPPHRANPAGSVLYRSGLNPKIQRNFEVFSPCDFIAAIT